MEDLSDFDLSNPSHVAGVLVFLEYEHALIVDTLVSNNGVTRGEAEALVTEFEARHESHDAAYVATKRAEYAEAHRREFDV